MDNIFSLEKREGYEKLSEISIAIKIYAEEVYFIEDEDFPSYEELRKLEENE